MVRHFCQTRELQAGAQINGYRGETQSCQRHEKTERQADIWYIENWSFFY